MLNHFGFYVDPVSDATALSRTILLVRHAAHDELGMVLSGRSDIPLNADGRRQAAKLSERLAAVPLTEVSTSPRRRARETAVFVANLHGLEPNVVEGLD